MSKKKTSNVHKNQDSPLEKPVKLGNVLNIKIGFWIQILFS